MEVKRQHRLMSRIFRTLILTLLIAMTVYFAHHAIARTSPATQPSDSTRLIGTWHATLLNDNVVPVSLTWTNREDGYTTTTPGANGPIIVGSGEFVAEDGQWKTSNPYGPADEGTYHFMDPNNVVMEGEAGVVIVWTREIPKDESAPKTSSAQPRITGVADDLKVMN
jgi:hypothetical protein